MRTRAPEYIRARREADAGWVRRNRRSLGLNRQFRALVRQAYIDREALEQLAEQAAKKHEGLAAAIKQRIAMMPNQLSDAVRRAFTRRAS